VKSFQEAEWDFEKMVRSRLKTLREGRLNADRVMALSDDNPHKTMMFELAEGMFVALPTGFTPNGQGPHAALRKSYVTVHSAVDKMLTDLVIQRLAFLIPKSLATANI
jgi:hypothetical protein